ncbi:MAG: recombinase family protein, partial [Deltaproteobacteria bacterium]|nr:recombinase family protein [Deltaproteobacteria bacterium]
KIFHQKGSAYGVVHEFARLGMKFPKRQYGGAWSGQLIWGQLSHNRVLTILKNPCYSGVYTYGKSARQKVISAHGGDIIFRVKNLPISLWQVIIKNHHPAYISWEEFLENQKKLKSNQTNGEENILSGAAREGLALLQGLVICGQCGRKLHVRYKGNNGIYPTYQCNRLKGEGLSKSYCMSVRCDLLDDAVSDRILEILKEDQVSIALKAVEELERRDKSIDKQWQMRIERAEYEAHLSQRRYEQVDPSNRLVASTLEKNWNDALIKLQELNEEFTGHKKKHGLCITPEEKERLFALVQDVPRLWKSPTTQSKDKKRMLRLFIKDITVERRADGPDERKAILHLRWQGGASEDIAITLPQKIYERQRYSTEIVEMVRNLAKEKMDSEIANYLNQQGYQSATSKSFTPAMIKWIRYKYKISSAQLKQPGELTVDDILKKFGVKRSMVYYWIERGIISGRRLNKGSPYWITITPEKERELYRWCKKSKKIQTKNFTNFKKPIAGGAV